MIPFQRTNFGLRPVSRREFLGNFGMGFGGIALASLLSGAEAAPPSSDPDAAAANLPHLIPKARSVIFLFMVGGVSHLESFDPKPALNRYAGKSISQTPYKDVIYNPLIAKNLQRGLNHKLMQEIFPLQTGFRKFGQSGIEVADWFPRIGGAIDDIAVVRSMWTTDNNHQAQYQLMTGRNISEGNFPSLGAWVHYGLGSLNDDLPQFIVLGSPLGTCCGTIMAHGADYLGQRHAGMLLDTDGNEALPFARPEAAITPSEQRAEFDLIKSLDGQSDARYPLDTATEARIKSYELAFRMQMAVPEVMSVANESQAIQHLYGLDRLQGAEGRFAKQCLLARRFVERGTRFIQIHHGAGGAGAWDAHSELKKNHSAMANEVDQPIAALLQDLKQRGLLDSTLVVFASEFGRTPGLEISEIQPTFREGRDHHPYGFSVWLAGGGIKGGTVHGMTDELGFHAVVDRHYITDLHATILHQLGLESERLNIPGQKRIQKDYGQVIQGILA
jgi:hypothetical protein